MPGNHFRSGVRGWLYQEIARFLVRLQEGLDLLAQLAISAANLFEKGASLTRHPLQSEGYEPINLLKALGRHPAASG